MFKAPKTFNTEKSHTIVALAFATLLSLMLSVYLASGLGQHFADVLLAAFLLFSSIELGRRCVETFISPLKISWQELCNFKLDSYSRAAIFIAIIFALMQMSAAGGLQDVLLGTLFFSACLYFVCVPISRPMPRPMQRCKLEHY
ncbi:hypothetical protein [uncultured Pseudoteredinibacter sp.]|uniref:hypothetical protein n=1 Tax=uncultured Pseudoteredinibacter sp. TaxID=1641701 RepID=UPI002627F93B|nr:hypothetical protein [uncultured Pseudoteredinibacter sp.]